MISTTSPDGLSGRFSGVFRKAGRLSRWLGLCLAGSVLLFPSLVTHATNPVKDLAPLRVLIVGGGPNLENNQVAIESNVRYVGKLLPGDTTRTTLFADGDANHATVLYDDDPRGIPAGERIFNLVMRGSDSSADNPSHYRKPNLGGKLDGPSKRTEIQHAFTQLASEQESTKRPLLLYFTGHGSSNQNDLENNMYDLWGGNEGLTVRDLSKQIARLPEETPVTIVMVQCFSGAFGNLIFEEGNPKGEPVKRDLAGFFATVKERVAAGCTSAVNEAEYHDFTSYFFAALTGRDRVGRRVTGADYNGDGHVGMDEAYCYTLIHDESIDVPVCTSDVFLRRFVPLKDSELFQTSYSSVLSWASPAQKAALEGLSAKLGRKGEDRLNIAYGQMLQQTGSPAGWRAAYRVATQKFESERREGKRLLLGRWPELRRPGTDDYRKARGEAIAQLTREAEAGKWKELLDSNEAVDKTDLEGEAREIATSQNLRFVRLGKSVILAHWLKEHGEAPIKARYSRLIEDEGRTLLLPADQISRR